MIPSSARRVWSVFLTPFMVTSSQTAISGTIPSLKSAWSTHPRSLQEFRHKFAFGGRRRSSLSCREQDPSLYPSGDSDVRAPLPG